MTDTIAQKTNALIALKTKYEHELDVIRDKIVAIDAILSLDAKAFAILASLDEPSTSASSMKIAPAIHYKTVSVDIVPSYCKTLGGEVPGKKMGNYDDINFFIEGEAYWTGNGDYGAGCAAFEHHEISGHDWFAIAMAGSKDPGYLPAIKATKENMAQHLPSKEMVENESHDYKKLKIGIPHYSFLLILAYMAATGSNVTVYNAHATPPVALRISSRHYCWANTVHLLRSSRNVIHRLLKRN